MFIFAPILFAVINASFTFIFPSLPFIQINVISGLYCAISNSFSLYSVSPLKYKVLFSALTIKPKASTVWSAKTAVISMSLTTILSPTFSEAAFAYYKSFKTRTWSTVLIFIGWCKYNSSPIGYETWLLYEFMCLWTWCSLNSFSTTFKHYENY